jgi:hypothetical protein
LEVKHLWVRPICLSRNSRCIRFPCGARQPSYAWRTSEMLPKQYRPLRLELT